MGTGKRARRGAADITVERLAAGFCRSLGHGEGHAENGIGAEAGFVGRAIKGDHGAVNGDLVFGVHVDEGFENFAVHGGHGVEHALAAIALLVAIAEFHGFMGTSGSAGRHRGTAEGVVLKDDIHLDGRVAAAVKNFAGGNVENGGHGALRMKSAGLMTWTCVECKKG